MPMPPLPAISKDEEVNPAAPHILDGDDGVGRHEFQAGFEEQFLGEGVAHLHRWPLLLGGVAEFGRGHGRAVDPVASGFGTHVRHRISRAAGFRTEDAVRVREGRPSSR